MNGRASNGAELVLLVDDSPDTLTMLTEALEASGLTVVVARDGKTALTLVDRVEPDLVLLDAVMPGIDGFETCRRLKTDPRFASIPVIFMTGLSHAEDIVRGLEVGGVDFVTKPVDHDVLIARIAVHAANSRLIAETQTALDASGRAVVALDAEGRVQWASPQAGHHLDKIAEPELGGAAAAAELAAWLRQSAMRPVSDQRPFVMPAEGGAEVEFIYLSRTPKGAHLVRVIEASGETAAIRLSANLGLTPREGDVLAWLADGKANKDIAEILCLSPRTITKHLEQIYAKLGVENRTAAVSMALRSLEK